MTVAELRKRYRLTQTIAIWQAVMATGVIGAYQLASVRYPVFHLVGTTLCIVALFYTLLLLRRDRRRVVEAEVRWNMRNIRLYTDGIQARDVQ